MIEEYLNQTVTLKTKGVVNSYNEPTYSSVSIKARFEYKRRMTRNALGETIVSLATCYTNIQVKPDDLIVFDGVDWVVLTVANVVDLFGNSSHYEVML